MIEIAIMGFGIVGSGVAEVMAKNEQSIAKKAGNQLRVKRILDLREFPGSPFAGLFTSSFEDIESDREISIVVETMGGLHPSYEYVKRCMLAGKSVVTSNKELVAEKGDELLALAKERNLNFLFEASVGGGIPILRPLDQCLAANEVYEIAGILNGTTNFVLTKMIREGMSFDDALALAQSLGYAERNPSSDVDGHDTCRKICILASLAYGLHVYPKDVYTEGISKITLDDVRYAGEWGGVIKLCGCARKLEDGRIDCIVAPMILPRESQLAEVNDVFNGILVRGDAIGDVVFYGRGAGKLPTASAVVADVIDEAKHLDARKSLFWEPGRDGYVADSAERVCAVMIRLRGDTEEDAERAAHALSGALGECEIVTVNGEPAEELAVVTPAASRLIIDSALARLNNVTVISRIRIAGF